MLKPLLRSVLCACLTISEFAFAQSALAQYDGLYVGTARLTGNPNNYSCGSSDPYATALFIQGGAVRYMYNSTRNEIITGTVSADGSVRGFGNSSSGGNELKGKISGKKLNAEFGSSGCTYTLDVNLAPDLGGFRDGLACSRLREICHQLTAIGPGTGCDTRFNECMQTGQWNSVIMNRSFSATRN